MNCTKKTQSLIVVVIILLYCVSFFFNTNLTAVYAEDDKHFSIVLKHGKKTFEISESEFIINSKIHTVTDKSSKYNRKGSLKEKLETIEQIKNMGISLDVAFNFVFKDFSKKINKIVNAVSTKVVDAKVKFNPLNLNMFSFIPEKEGVSVDLNLLYAGILNGLKNSSKISLQIPTVKILPKYTVDALSKATALRGGFATCFKASTPDRKHNIVLALSKFNGLIIYPNIEVSFNKITGKRTKDAGYLEANIIADGIFTPGIGGGVCQVSSTLYNALLEAGISITESHNHSIPVSYVQLGFDAMVSYSFADLRFVNNTNFPLYIKAVPENDNIKFEVYGEELSETVLEKISEIIKTTPALPDKTIKDTNGKYEDKVMFKGEFYRVSNARIGQTVNSYLVVKEGSSQVKRFIRKSVYPAMGGLIVEGVHDLPPGFSLPGTNIN